MTVYVDLLFWLNTIINYLLLQGSAVMGGYSAGIRRLLAASVLGGLYAVVAVIPGLELLQGPAFQLVSGVGMLVLAFGWKKSTVKQGLFFFALSFAFGGAVLLLVQLAEPNCLILGGRAYYAVTTPALLLLAGACYGLAAAVLAGWGTHTGGDVVKLELELNEVSVPIRALRDTGNTLRDPLTGQGILVVEWQVLALLLPEAALTQTQFRDPATLVEKLTVWYPQLRFRLVTYEAVGVDHGLLPAVRCRMRQGGRSTRILAAFSANKVSAQGRFEALAGGVVT